MTLPATLATALSAKGRITSFATNCSLSLNRLSTASLTSPTFTKLRAFRPYRFHRSFGSNRVRPPVFHLVENLASKHQPSNADKASSETRTRTTIVSEVDTSAHTRNLSDDTGDKEGHSSPGLVFERYRAKAQRKDKLTQKPSDQTSVLGDRLGMSVSAELLTTPTADTAGTTLVLRTANKHYVFGSQAEGTQRALVQQGTRLLKAQDFFLTGKAEWKNTGGFVGLMLTLADSTSTSYDTAMETARLQRARGKNVDLPTKPRFNIYGPPNLKHTLGTCRRFIFRKGIPIEASEFRDAPVSRNGDGNILPTWEDANLQVWALSVSPAGHQVDAQAEAELEARQKLFDEQFNTFGNHLAPDNETTEERELRYDRIRDVLLKCMFDSNWSFDTLVERHISEVEMPAAIFVRNPETHGYEPYTGPRPGGSESLPDIRVFTRTPWPGATVKALPPTRPAPECVSYIVRTLPSRGVFDVQKAKALGIKPGPDFGKLTAGKSVQNSAGEWIKPEQVVGPDRPGQGIVILEVPTAAYLEAIVQREELVSPYIMNGIGAIIWALGPGVAAHPTLKEFMDKLNNVQHIVSSLDVSPNRVGYDSVAGQATRLMQIDPTRYATPVYDNVTVPQHNLLSQGERGASALPQQAVVADRGLSFVLMPKFVAKLETKSPQFNADEIKQQTEATILQLAEAAQQAVRADKTALQKWRQLLARPDTEVITLGTGSALPSKYRNVSATLVRVPGVGNYLLDSGENTLGQLARIFSVEELSDIIKNLRIIWISHLHADHHLGTASVIHAWYHLVHGGVPNPDPIDISTLARDSNKYGLAVISHSGMLQWLNEYSSIEDFGYSRILPIEISPNSQGKASELNILDSFNETTERPTLIGYDLYRQLFGFTNIQAAKVAHCHGAMAVSVTFPPSPTDPKGVKPLKFSYSGDCRPSDHFARIGLDTTVLIHEATFDDELRGDAIAKKHSTTSEALGIGARMNAKAVVLTHFSQRYQKIPVLQSVADGETEEPLADLSNAVQETIEDEDMEVDPTNDNADNVDIHPTSTPSTTKHQGSSALHENERIIKIGSKDMKVAIAFDYMRVKIGEIAELEKFNEALNELLVKDEEMPEDDGSTINANGKKTSGDEGGGKKKKKKEKNMEGAPKKQTSKRNN